MVTKRPWGRDGGWWMEEDGEVGKGEPRRGKRGSLLGRGVDGPFSSGAGVGNSVLRKWFVRHRSGRDSRTVERG